MRAVASAAALLLLAAAPSRPPVDTETAAVERAFTGMSSRDSWKGAAFSTAEVDAPRLRSPTRPRSAETVALRLPQHPERCRAANAPCWLMIYLPGFDSTPESFGAALAPALDRAEASGAPPIIVATLDPRTNLGGGFYMDSPAAGAWETFVVTELLPALRRVAPAVPADHLLIMGHSMGGFGALYLAMRHPTVFPRAAALSPLIRPEGIVQILMPSVERSHPDQSPDPTHLIMEPTESHFSERVLWAELAAMTSAAPNWSSHLATSPEPWHLDDAGVQMLSSYDLATPDAAEARALPKLQRVFLAVGSHDTLIPTADVQAFAASAKTDGLTEGRIHVSVTDGTHTSHLPDDIAEAVSWLTKE